MKQVILFFAGFVISASTFGQELVTNGDFETWEDENTPNNFDKAQGITESTAIVHGGTYSAQQTATEDSGKRKLAESVAIEAGKTYTVSLWYYSVKDDTEGNGCRIWAKWQDESGEDVDDEDSYDLLQGPGGDDHYLTASGEQTWTQYTTSVTAPETATSLYFEVRTYKNCTTYWDDFSVQENSTTSVGDINNDISVYPSPFSSQLNIAADAITSVEILKISGVKVFEFEYDNSGKVEINTSNLFNGIYIVKLQQSNGNIITKKVVKK